MPERYCCESRNGLGPRQSPNSISSKHWRDVLTKPFEPAPFLAVIDEIMQESAAVRTT